MGLFTEMVQGFKELKAETDVLEFINKLLNCAVKNREEFLGDPPPHVLLPVFIPFSIASVLKILSYY